MTDPSSSKCRVRFSFLTHQYSAIRTSSPYQSLYDSLVSKSSGILSGHSFSNSFFGIDSTTKAKFISDPSASIMEGSVITDNGFRTRLMRNSWSKVFSPAYSDTTRKNPKPLVAAFARAWSYAESALELDSMCLTIP